MVIGRFDMPLKKIISNLQTTLGKMEIAFGVIHESIIWTNEKGSILWCNKSFDELVAHPHIALLGASAIDVLPLEKDGIKLSPDQHPFQLLRNNPGLSKNIYVFPTETKCISLQFTGNKAQFELDEVIFIFTIQNVTDLLTSQQELKKAKKTLEGKVLERTDQLLNVSKRFKNIVTEAVDGVITIDEHGIINSFNPAAEKIFGYSEVEIIGKNVSHLMPSPHSENHDHYIREYIRSGTKKVIGIGREVIGLRRNGKTFPMDLAVSESKLKNQILFTGIIRDISDRKEAEEDLERAKYAAEKASRIKSDFLARMSHDLRTPMNVILGMAELLNETTLTSQQKGYIQISQNAGNHLLSLINDILDIEKIEAGKLRLEAISFDLLTLLSETHDISSVAAEEKGLTLEYYISPETPSRIVGDPFRLQQILINLIGNAVKFTDRGLVSFHVRKGADVENGKDSPSKVKLHFEVRDTGAGIEKKNLETIFESYTQTEHGQDRKFGGTGLGLTISKRLVQLMGGDISASSALGEGATFAFDGWFLSDEQTSKKVAANAVQANASSGILALPGPLNILLVEDSLDNRFLFEAFLKQSDCTLDFADNGKTAFEKFKSFKYDLVLMDIQMPILDGYSATQLIRSHEKQNNMCPTPIIALSAYASGSEKEKALQAGCDMHVAKPVGKKNLLTAICSLLGKDNQPDHKSGKNKTSTIKVHIDKLLEDLIPGFLGNRRDDIKKLYEAVQQGDMDSIEFLGHTMKGTGGGYGFQKISELGEALERAAQKKDTSSVLRLTEELEKYLDTVEVVFVE